MLMITLSGPQLADVALSTIRATIGTDRYQYLSGPITGGPRLLAWHAAAGRHLPPAEASAACSREVVAANIADLTEQAAHQRALGRPTIEPGSFEADFDHWGQPEFYAFWDRVLEAHASAVRFVPDWAYSAGCVFEFHRARVYRLPCLDLEGRPICRIAALEAIDEALATVAASHDHTDPRDARIARLHAGIATHRTMIAEGR